MSKIFSMIRRLAMSSAFFRKALFGIAIGCALGGWCGVVYAQTAASCGANGYRVTGKRWDPVLRKGFEYRQECAHPEWPVRLVPLVSAASYTVADNAPAKPIEWTNAAEPLLVNAGAPVRLWMEDRMVRIEMSGVAERSGRKGEHVTVQVTHQSEETGLSVEHIAGIVRGPGEVEMER